MKNTKILRNKTRATVHHQLVAENSSKGSFKLKIVSYYSWLKWRHTQFFSRNTCVILNNSNIFISWVKVYVKWTILDFHITIKTHEFAMNNVSYQEIGMWILSIESKHLNRCQIIFNLLDSVGLRKCLNWKSVSIRRIGIWSVWMKNWLLQCYSALSSTIDNFFYQIDWFYRIPVNILQRFFHPQQVKILTHFGRKPLARFGRNARLKMGENKNKMYTSFRWLRPKNCSLGCEWLKFGRKRKYVFSKKMTDNF